jgi:hypothetical protein
MADAAVLKTVGKPCGFESRRPHHQRRFQLTVVPRRFLAIAVALSTLFSLCPSDSHAARVPTCRGEVATHWLNTPGSLVVADENAVIVGSNGNDYIESKGQNALICAGGGSDYVLVWSPDDSFLGSVIYLGPGNDRGTFWYGSTVYGESGDDNSILVVESSTAFGRSGDDWIVAERGSSAHGGSGNDTFYSLGAANINGGSGNDDLTILGDIEAVNCGSGSDHVTFEYPPQINPQRCEIASP